MTALKNDDIVNLGMPCYLYTDGNDTTVFTLRKHEGSLYSTVSKMYASERNRNHLVIEPLNYVMDVRKFDEIEVMCGFSAFKAILSVWMTAEFSRKEDTLFTSISEDELMFRIKLMLC